MPMDDEGMVVERLPATTRIVCVTPSHQFPLGPVMSLRRRAALIEFARKHGAVIVEDDYDGEFRFGGGPVDALQTLDRSGCVFSQDALAAFIDEGHLASHVRRMRRVYDERRGLHDVRLAPLRPFYAARPTKSGIVFGYGGIDNHSMLEALERLRRALIR